MLRQNIYLNDFPCPWPDSEGPIYHLLKIIANYGQPNSIESKDWLPFSSRNKSNQNFETKYTEKKLILWIGRDDKWMTFSLLNFACSPYWREAHHTLCICILSELITLFPSAYYLGCHGGLFHNQCRTWLSILTQELLKVGNFKYLGLLPEGWPWGPWRLDQRIEQNTQSLNNKRMNHRNETAKAGIY